MKKFFSLLLAVAMVLSLAPTAYAAPQNINGAGANCDANCVAEGVTFATNNLLTIDDDASVGNTGGVSFNPAADNTGSVTANLDTTITGTTGTAANDDITDFNLANAGTDVTFNGNIFLQNDIDMTAATQSVILADNVSITSGAASITNSSGAAAGTLTANGTSTISGTVGGAGVASLSVINAGAATDTVTFTGNTFATTMNVTGTGNIALNGSHTGVLDYDAGGTVTLANAQAITGNITNSSGTNGTGTLVLANTATITGSIGASGSGLSLITLATASAKAITGSVFATTMNFSADGTLTMSDNANLNATMTTTGGAGTGNLTFSGTSTLTGTFGTNVLYLNDITANGAAETVTLAGNVFADTYAQGAANTINLGANTLDLDGAATGAFTLDANGTMALTINSATVFGNVDVNNAGGGVVTMAGTNTVNVTVNGGITNGQTFLVIDGTSGIAAVAGTITDNSALVSFTATEPAAGDLLLTASVNTAGIGTTSNSSNTLTALNTSLSGANADMISATGQLFAISDATTATAAVETLDPTNNGATTQASFNVSNAVNSAISGHLTGGGVGNGIATGDFWTDQAFWVKGIGNGTDQDPRNGVSGYESSLWGTIVGFDGEIATDLRMGLAGGYASTEVDNSGEAGGTDIDSYIGSIYFGYDDPSPWYGNFGFTFTFNEYESTRSMPFANAVAASETDGQNYSGFMDLGYVITDEAWGMGALEITPIASLTYSHLDLDGYTETGATGLNLVVADQDYDSVETGLGVRLAYPVNDSSGKWVPEVHYRWLYDWVDDQVQTTASFASSTSGASFTTNGLDPEESTHNVGAGITFFTKGDVSITGVYDYEFGDDFASHTGQGVVRWQF